MLVTAGKTYRKNKKKMAMYSFPLQVKGSIPKHSISNSFDHIKTSQSSTVKVKVKPFLKELQQIPMKVDMSKSIRNNSLRILDAVVDSVFQFDDQPLLPSQSNFAPVDEIGETIEVHCTEGKIPTDFPEGVYIRNGSNPLFGGLKSVSSIFGTTSHSWVEGEGMLHALHILKNAHGELIISYNNRYVETKTFKLEKQRNKPSFLPAILGDSPAVLASYLFNLLRFNAAVKDMANTSVFEHSGKLYAIAENHLPQEIDILTLETNSDWDLDRAWGRPFNSHPKRAPGSGELVIMGIDAMKPFYVVGVISADGKKLVHKVDLKFDRCALSHEIGVTQKYNIIFDYPLTIDPIRVFKGGPMIKFSKEDYARIGVMPRYGDADSVKWFEVEPLSTVHIFNCFEDGNEVVVRGCSAPESIYPGPDYGRNKFEWFARGFTKPTRENSNGSMDVGYLFHRPYEYRLNMETGEVKKRYITGTDLSMDFCFINENFTGLKHRYGYTEVSDTMASSSCGMPKFGGLAKLYFDKPHPTLSVEEENENDEHPVKIEYHKFAENNFCSGSVFVSRKGGVEEDDGWVVSFVHNEETNVSQVHIVDAKAFESEPIAKITLPQRVPYGFHGTYVTIPGQP